MDVIDLTIAVLQARDTAPHCLAELGGVRPVEHWKTHCCNCGVHMGRKHVEDDCPAQRWEAAPKEQEDKGE